MTKQEYEKCTNVMEEAIRKAEYSKECWAAYEKQKEANQIEGEIKLRLAENSQGYAAGINQALNMIGFKHDKMKELFSLL